MNSCSLTVLVDQISIDPRTERAYSESKARLEHLVQCFKDSDESHQMTKDIKEHKEKKIKNR